jgi:hypothetical protein
MCAMQCSIGHAMYTMQCMLYSVCNVCFDMKHAMAYIV